MEPAFKNIFNKKVLIIDDEVDLCLLMKSYFLRKECYVIIAHTMQDALQIMKKDVPDVVILGLYKNVDKAVKMIMEVAPGVQIIVGNENKN